MDPSSLEQGDPPCLCLRGGRYVWQHTTGTASIAQSKSSWPILHQISPELSYLCKHVCTLHTQTYTQTHTAILLGSPCKETTTEKSYNYMRCLDTYLFTTDINPSTWFDQLRHNVDSSMTEPRRFSGFWTDRLPFLWFTHTDPLSSDWHKELLKTH